MRALRKSLGGETKVGGAGEFRALPVDFSLDDRTAAYVLKAQASFESLRNAAAQLAGLLVMASIGGRDRVLDAPILEQASRAHGEAEDRLLATEAPPAAAHHHFHLSLASEKIGKALQIARQGALRLDEASFDQAHQALRSAWQDMLSASNALPGFQVVDFAQSCCAAHQVRAPGLHIPRN